MVVMCALNIVNYQFDVLHCTELSVVCMLTGMVHFKMCHIPVH